MESHDRMPGTTSPDFSLLISRLEAQVTKGKNPETVRKVLRKESLWKKFGTDMQLRWANLAQMSGQVEIALGVLAHINSTHPHLVEAWSQRLDLLMILDRREEMARVLAACRQSIGQDAYREWLNRLNSTGEARKDEDIAGISAPFDTIRQRQMAIKHYMDLFSGRENCFARQWAHKADGKQGYVPVRRPMEPGDMEEHLRGRKTYGIYLLKSDATVNVAVIDMDVAKEFRRSGMKAEEKQILKREHGYIISRIREQSNSLGIKPLLEFSGGKGFHFWFFFSTPVEAAKARKTLHHIIRGLDGDVRAFNLEIFPKQDHLSGKGLGNLVKLPLGVHRLTGKKSYFPGCADR